MFDMFDSLLLGKEIDYDGKTYFYLSTLRDGLITAVEKEAELPAPVVVIKYQPNPPKEQLWVM